MIEITKYTFHVKHIDGSQIKNLEDSGFTNYLCNECMVVWNEKDPDEYLSEYLLMFFCFEIIDS